MIKERIIVTLIESDYENGDFFDVENCPIAQALKRNGYEEIGVGGNSVDIGDKKYKISSSDNKLIMEITETILDNITEVEFEEPITPLTIYLDEILRET